MGEEKPPRARSSAPRGEEKREARLPVSFDQFAERLLDWYLKERRELPWRSNPDPYWVWLSEVMLQQTQVKAALPYFERFVQAYPTLRHLAQADVDEVLSRWSGLGYYSRARNLHRAARQVCRDHNGRFPRSYSEAVALPGIGRYTAGAVLSIAYGLAYPVVDGNVRRVMARFLCIEAELTSKSLERLWRLLEECVQAPAVQPRVSEFNQALMELGALVCTPRNPLCGRCPLADDCRGLAAGLAEELPRRSRRRKVEKFQYLVAVVADGPRYLLHQNHSETFLKGFWEFPRVDLGSAGQKEKLFRQQHGLVLVNPVPLWVVRHQITYRKMSFHPFKAELQGPLPGNGYAWAELNSPSHPVPAYVRKIERAALVGGPDSGVSRKDAKTQRVLK